MSKDQGAAKQAKLIELRENREEVDAIAQTTRKRLEEERNIAISRYEALPTIVYQFMEDLFQYLNKHKSQKEDVVINFANMFDIGVTYRESDDGEKDGNYVPFFTPGQLLKTTIKSDDETEE